MEDNPADVPVPANIIQTQDNSIKIWEGLLITVFLFVTSLLIFILIFKKDTLLEAFFYMLFYNAIQEGYAKKEFIYLIFYNIAILIPIIVAIFIKKRLCIKPIRLLYEFPGYSLAVSVVLSFVLMSMMFPAMYMVPLALAASIVLGLYYYFSNVSKSFKKFFLIIMAISFLFEIGYIGSQALPSIIGGEGYCGPASGSGYVDYGCFGEKSARENNKDICYELDDKVYQIKCIQLYALKSALAKKDLSYCEGYILEYDSSQSRDTCVDWVVTKIGTSLCDKEGPIKVREQSILEPEGYWVSRDGKRICYQLYCDSKESECYNRYYEYSEWEPGLLSYGREEARKRMENCFQELEGNLSLPEGVPFKRKTQYAERYCDELITAKFGEETIIRIAEN